MKRNSQIERQKNILEQAMEVRARELEEREQRIKAEQEANGEVSLTEEEIDAMYAAFKTRLHEEGLVDEAGNPTEKTRILSKKLESEEALQEQSDNLTAQSRKISARAPWKRVAKAAGLVLAVGACVFCLSMTSEANRMYWMEKVEGVWNGRSTAQINNSAERNYSITDEYRAKTEIAEKLNVVVPEFYYMPEGMQFDTYKMYQETGSAMIKYGYNDSYLYFEIANSELDSSRSIEQNEKVYYENFEIQDGTTLNVEIRDLSDDGYEQFIAQWSYKNTYYNLGGRISKEELRKILGKMKYDV